MVNTDLVDRAVQVRDANDEFAPLRRSTTELANLVACERGSLDELTATVRSDPELADRILRIASRGWGARRSEVRTVRQAILRLGPGTVLNLAVGPAVAQRFASPVPRYGLTAGELWRHSVASSLAIERARVHCSREIAPEASTAALLHDVGKLVLARRLEEAYAEEPAQDFDACHGELGAQIVSAWGLPDSIAQTVRFHHAPLLAPTCAVRRLCFLVALADAVASSLGTSCGTEEGPNEFTPALAGALGISSRGFERLRLEVDARLDHVLAIHAEDLGALKKGA